MSERRKSTRISLQSRVELILADSEVVEVLRPNVGWGGLGFFTRDILPENGTVLARILFHDREGKPQWEEVRGSFIWNRRDGNFTAAGVAFEAIREKDHPRLFSYLNYAEGFE
ncbi:MAG TPA: PilZ domain-containing protein [Nitrospiria bacterium]|nr:PilZ domain-containing protein [Nitrospiria bacterium]